MHPNKLRHIIDKNYYVVLQDRIRKGYLEDYDESSQIGYEYGQKEYVHEMATNFYIYHVIDEIKEKSKLLDPLEIPLFYQSLKSQISEPLKDFNDSKYFNYINKFIFKYINFINILDENYNLETRKLPTAPAESKQIEPKTKLNKIKWLGTPSQFSHIFLELANNDYIETPKHEKDMDKTNFARLCFEHFDIDTTPGNLEKEFRSDSNLSLFTKSLFQIPLRNEIQDKRSGPKKKKE